ncbi:septal ring lytic transglycosylase RlpA family protein [Bartonella sp. CB178]|uniref:septal ring lytic transglycosylase RlpA family protein n=1 Tax=Bartonella sp. CB178 TaxID=3112255 RepID=UPI00300E3AAD
MFKNKKKSTSIIKSASQTAIIIAISQLLVSCSTSKIAQFAAKSSDHNEISEVKTVSKPKKVSSKRDIKKIPDKQNKTKKNSIGYATVGKPYKIKGKWYYPQRDPAYKRVGEASWYGGYFHGRLTANGEIYDMNLLTAAHPTMPLPSYARVTNLENGSSIVVRVNDRGPFMKDRIIDLSKQAATMLGYANAGVTNVEVEYISEAPIGYYDGAYLTASYRFGDPGASLLALSRIPREKQGIIAEELNTNSQEGLIKVGVKQRILNGADSLKLPEVGPILINKPISFDQVAFANKKF